MNKKIKNFYNPPNNSSAWLAGSLTISQTVFSYGYRNPAALLRQGVVCKNKADAEHLAEFLQLCARAWQLSNYGEYPTPEFTNELKNKIQTFIENYGPADLQLELFPTSIIDLYKQGFEVDEIALDRARREAIARQYNFSDKSRKLIGL